MIRPWRKPWLITWDTLARVNARRDGTKVPVSIVHKRGIALDGKATPGQYIRDAGMPFLTTVSNSPRLPVSPRIVTSF